MGSKMVHLRQVWGSIVQRVLVGLVESHQAKPGNSHSHIVEPGSREFRQC